MGRRDFTINAIAKRLATGELLDPFDGEQTTSRRGVLRTVSPQSFREDPLRLVRGLRFVSQHDLEPDEDTLRQMREDARVDPSRLGRADRRWAHGRRDGRALEAPARCAPGEGAAAGARHGRARRAAPGVRARDRVRAAERAAAHTLDEHTSTVVQAAADAGAPLEVRLAALLHDLGKPSTDGKHAELSAQLRSPARSSGRLRYPAALAASRERRRSRSTRFRSTDIDALFARRMLAEHGDEVAHDLAHAQAGRLRGKRVPRRGARGGGAARPAAGGGA